MKSLLHYIIYTTATLPAKSLWEAVLTNSALTCVYLQRSEIREMSRGHETGAKTCCPAAHWAGWERPVGGAEQSMPPPTLRPESYRFLLCVKSRCWWTSKGNEGRKKGRRGKKKGGKRKRVWKMEQEAESSAGSCHLPSSLPPTVPGAASCDLQEDSNATSAPLPFTVLALLGSLLLQGLKWPWTRGGWRFCQWRRRS